MALLARILLLLAVALAAFAWWGMFTAGGNRAFDEMAGMIPFGAALLAALLVVGAGIAGLVARRRRRS